MAKETMHNFLQDIELTKYENLLTGQGYTEEQDIFTLTEADLNSVQITEPTDRNTILNAVSQIPISAWLKYYKLEEYERHFKRLGIKTLEDLKRSEMCDDMMNELEVMIPGHRKRLAMAASHIHSTGRRKEREPIAYGYWGKNDVVPASETDFLWVDKCFIKSNILGNDPVELLNCMVDTGSEVVTIKDEILPQLNLRFVQTINSKGIHKVEEKPLYRGVLVMGGHGKEVEVDVMPDSYNSVGCNVFQKFAHVIDGSKHFWLESEN